MESILNSIKKMLGPSEEYDYFDPDIIIHINSAFMILNQMGVGPDEGFSITDESAVWSDFIPDNKIIELVKSYVYFKVKIMFDPPDRSVVADAINRTISELEWRLNVATGK